MKTRTVAEAIAEINAMMDDLVAELTRGVARKETPWYADRVRSLEGLSERRARLVAILAD